MCKELQSVIAEKLDCPEMGSLSKARVNIALECAWYGLFFYSI